MLKSPFDIQRDFFLKYFLELLETFPTFANKLKTKQSWEQEV